MIISRTPLRISFAGGGSDLPVFYHDQIGAVVSTAIKKYIYITVNKGFDDKIVVRYSKEEKVNNINDLGHNLIREALRLTGIEKGVDISSIADIPSEGSGLGSSSSYVVGVLNALYAFKGQHVTSERLAKEACQIEMEILKKPVGKQDQYIAAFGGIKYIQFNPDESVFIDPVIFLPETKRKLENKLLLFYTGITRSADRILVRQNSNLTHSSQKIKMTKNLVKLAEEAGRALRKNKLDTFGEILHENWEIKRGMAEGITSPQIDEWYHLARKNGATGGKILGAGGGGFLLLYAPENKHKNILHALPFLKPMEVKFEPQGSKIIFVGE